MTIWPEISFQDRIDTSEFRIHERAHITVNDDSCRGCTTRECVVACPANLFVPTSDGGSCGDGACGDDGDPRRTHPHPSHSWRGACRESYHATF